MGRLSRRPHLIIQFRENLPTTPYGPPPSAAHEFLLHFVQRTPYGPDTRPARVSNFRESFNQPCRGRLSRRPANIIRGGAATFLGGRCGNSKGRAAWRGGPYGVDGENFGKYDDASGRPGTAAPTAYIEIRSGSRHTGRPGVRPVREQKRCFRTPHDHSRTSAALVGAGALASAGVSG